jgi:hypothetical protein
MNTPVAVHFIAGSSPALVTKLEKKMKNKLKPYTPLPYRQGNKVIREYKERFDDGAGHTGSCNLVDYITSKGKLIEGFTMQVIWDNNKC